MIATEGAETEPIYFQELHPGRDGNFRLKILGNPNHKSRPAEVVNRLLAYERQERHGPDTDYWAIIDRDAWRHDELCEAWALMSGRSSYHLAMSNPCFELWLWLHLRPNRPFADRHDCQRSLMSEWPEFRKGDYDAGSLVSQVEIACSRAREIDEAPDTAWPVGQATRVYQLVEKLK
ncbi:MAG: RloB family protein [Roseimicrobium sp.]